MEMRVRNVTLQIRAVTRHLTRRGAQARVSAPTTAWNRARTEDLERVVKKAAFNIPSRASSSLETLPQALRLREGFLCNMRLNAFLIEGFVLCDHGLSIQEIISDENIEPRSIFYSLIPIYFYGSTK